LHGKIIDLNDLAPGYADVLYAANDINDAGRIAGQAFTPGTEQYLAVHAIPARRRHHDDGVHVVQKPSSHHAALPESIRQSLLQRFGMSESR
jgi:hypothetical protein